MVMVWKPTLTKVSGINKLWMKNFNVNPNCQKNGGRRTKGKADRYKKAKQKVVLSLSVNFLNKHTVIAGLIASVVVVSFEKWKWSIVQVLSLVKIFIFNIK